MAQAFSSRGASVVVVEAADRILAGEEEYVSEEIEAALAGHGVDVRTGVTAVSVSRGAGGQITLGLEGGDEVRGDELLVATGRRPRTAELALEKAGVEADGRGYLEVDDQLRVGGSDWLYAIGDVNGRALLTHMGKYQARTAADAILGEDVAATCDRKGSPRVIFTDPEVAAVGLTLAAAKEQGIDARAVDATTSANAGASFRGRNTPGTSRLVIDEQRRVLVGATFVGTEVAEMLHAATIAVVGEIPLETLWHAVPAFPTRNEVWLNLLEEYGL
jgi:pyruvate/2-oxoglutarate dehydrogenase complex dihydrolipoamide dehydrogenase (E3) component